VAAVTTIAERLDEVRARIAAAARRSGRSPGDVTLVAVSKGSPDEDVLAARAAGQRLFGENRPDQLAGRIARLDGDLSWHLIGHLQRRAVRHVLVGVAMIESLDRIRLAETLARRLPDVPPVLLEVNLAEEPQKHGVAPVDVPATAAAVVELGLDLRGLMAIPPRPETPEDSRPWFERLAELGDVLGRELSGPVELSMGMSDDFEVAVECGATIVRVGRAIFGERAATEPRRETT